MTHSKRQPEFATHKECAYFINGFCMLNGVAVDPGRAACPNFTAKGMIATPQTVKPYQQPQQLLQLAPPFRQRFLVPPSYPKNYLYKITPYPGHSDLMLSRGYSVPRQGGMGVYSMSSGGGSGRGSGGEGGRGRGRGRMGGFAAGPGGSCVCPSCGYTNPHRLGSPCFQQTCPRCGTPMTRKR